MQHGVRLEQKNWQEVAVPICARISCLAERDASWHFWGGRDTGQLLRMPQEHPSRHATPSPFATSPGPCHSDGEPGNRQGGRRQSHLLAPPPRREHLLKPLCQCLPLFLSHSLCGTNLALIWCVDLVPDHRQSCPGCGCH